MRYCMLQQSILFTYVLQTFHTRGLNRLMLCLLIFARGLNHLGSLCIFYIYLHIRPPILLTNTKVNIILENSDLWFLGIYGKKQIVCRDNFSCCLLLLFDIPKTILKCISKQNLMNMYHVVEEL